MLTAWSNLRTSSCTAFRIFVLVLAFCPGVPDWQSLQREPVVPNPLSQGSASPAQRILQLHSADTASGTAVSTSMEPFVFAGLHFGNGLTLRAAKLLDAALPPICPIRGPGLRSGLLGASIKSGQKNEKSCDSESSSGFHGIWKAFALQAGSSGFPAGTGLRSTSRITVSILKRRRWSRASLSMKSRSKRIAPV